MPYRVIAASTCQIVKIDAAKFQPILEEFSQLRQQLQQQYQQRQQLIFFKTKTELRELDPQQQQILWPYLLSYIEETRIPAGVSLAQQDQISTNHFWLCSGQIQGEKPPIVGNQWGHPDPVPEEWKAQTELIIYQLSAKQWDIASAKIADTNHRPKIGKSRMLTLVPPAPKTDSPGLPQVEKPKAKVLTNRC